MRVTLKMVAERAGVAVNTVSYVLNGKADLFRPETAERVRQAARDLGYRTNAGAKATRTGRFGTIGIVLDAGKVTWASELMLDGVHDGLAERRWHLIYSRLDISAKHPEPPPVLTELKADGLLMNFPPELCTSEVHRLLDGYLPTVWLNHKDVEDAVYPDDLEVGSRAANLALEHGHRRIAYLQFWTTGYHYSMRDRLEGYRQALRAAGCSDLSVLGEGTLFERAQLQAFERQVVRLLRRKQPPSCLIVYGATELDAALKVAWQLGLRVPQDISLIAVAETSQRRFDLALATVLLPMEAVGRIGSGMILQKVDRPHDPLPARAVAPGVSVGDSLVPVPVS